MEIQKNSGATPDELKEQQHRIAEKSAEIDKSQPSGCLIFFLSFLFVVWLFTEIGADTSSGGVAFLVIALTVVVFIVLLLAKNDEKAKKIDALKSDIQSEQSQNRDSMAHVFQSAKSMGFNCTSKVVDPRNKYCVAIDRNAKKFLVKDSTDPKFRIFNFSDLIDYELSQDGMTAISSRASDALVGGVLFGTTGAVIGAAKGKEVQEFCSSLYVSLTVNDTSAFRIQLPFISGKISKTSPEYKFAVERAKEMIALLQLVKSASNSEKKTSPAVDTVAVEAIKQYKELLDLGIITQEEFEAKRKELLKI